MTSSPLWNSECNSWESLFPRKPCLSCYLHGRSGWVCSYIFNTSAIGQEPRCRVAHGSARAAIHGGRSARAAFVQDAQVPLSTRQIIAPCIICISGSGQECRCRVAQGCARAAIHGDRGARAPIAYSMLMTAGMQKHRIQGYYSDFRIKFAMKAGVLLDK